jgi:alpha-L-fucosidase 2
MRVNSGIAVLAVGASLVGSTAPNAPVQNIEFGQSPAGPLFLDAGIPQGEGPFPAAILVHGGGWVRGDRQHDVAPLFAPLSQAGIAWFTIDYRLGGDVLQFGAAIDDVRAAVRFVKEHAAEYRVDPNRIALIGESAGGQLAAMAALRPEPGMDVKAVVAMYTPTDLPDLAKNSEFVPQQVRTALHGTLFAELILARLAQLSPVDNIGPDAPPFLLIHGTADRLVPYAQSVAMCGRMAAIGASCRLYSVPGAGHGMNSWEASRPSEAKAYKREMVRWLKGRLTAGG